MQAEHWWKRKKKSFAIFKMIFGEKETKTSRVYYKKNGKFWVLMIAAIDDMLTKNSMQK